MMANNLGLEGMTEADVAKMRQEFDDEDCKRHAARNPVQKAGYVARHWLFWHGMEDAAYVIKKLTRDRDYR